MIAIVRRGHNQGTFEIQSQEETISLIKALPLWLRSNFRSKRLGDLWQFCFKARHKGLDMVALVPIPLDWTSAQTFALSAHEEVIHAKI